MTQADQINIDQIAQNIQNPPVMARDPIGKMLKMEQMEAWNENWQVPNLPHPQVQRQNSNQNQMKPLQGTICE